MPELPDLQVFSRNLTKELAGKKVKKVAIPVTKKLNVSAAKLKKALEGNTLKEVVRVGKHLQFVFKDGTIVGLHLMLHGKLFFFDKKNENKHTICEILFNDGSGLAITDFQKMATLTLNPEEKDTPDALAKEVNAKYLQQHFKDKKTPVKNIITDQDVITGIGNAYADEILWDARLSPFSVAGKVPAPKISQLAKSIKSVLKKAEKQIQKEHPGIIGGEERDFMQIHNAHKTHSPTGAEIKKQAFKGRKTYYTEEQELFE
ncbi:MAG: DNA-formamidopyrimidine glycosylase family protein [Candidatus Dadabacteria bacterium]